MKVEVLGPGAYRAMVGHRTEGARDARLTLLGGFQARLGTGGALSLPSRKAQALLAYLGARPGQSHPRDKLAALLWGESREAQARDGLRHALAALRQALPATAPPILMSAGQTLALNPVVVDVDVATFERHVAGARPRPSRRPPPLPGDLLSGFSVERAAVRGVADGRAGAAARAGRRGARGDARHSAHRRRGRSRLADGVAANRARPAPGVGAPHAHASLRSARAAGLSPPTVPALCGSPAARAWRGARGGDQAALPGDPPPATCRRGGPRAGHDFRGLATLRTFATRVPHVGHRYPPHRARPGDGTVASDARRGGRWSGSGGGHHR